jgi:hypothetical protein
MPKWVGGLGRSALCVLVAFLLCLAFLPGRVLASEQVTQLWSYELTGTESITSQAISADGNYIVVGSDESRVFLFSHTSSTPLWIKNLGASSIGSVAISSDGGYIVAASDFPNCIYLFSRENNTPIWSHGPLSSVSYPTSISNLTISADGNYIAYSICTYLNDWTNDFTDTVYLLSRDNGAPLWEHEMEMNYGVQSVAISSDGSYIAVAAMRVRVYPMAELYDSYIYLFSSNSSTPIWSYYTPPNYSCAQSVSISLDGSRVFTSGGMLLFSRSDNTPFNIQGPGGSVQLGLAAMSADGRYIACGGGNSDYYTDYVGLLSADNGASLWGYNTSTGSSSSYGITSIAISADGNYIAATEEFEQDYITLHGLYLFSSSSSTPVWKYVPGWTEDPGNLKVAGISSDGSYILFASGYGIVLYEREAVLSSTNLAVSPSSFSISPGGTITLTATLTSDGEPLPGENIIWSTTSEGMIGSSTTNNSGQASVAYTTPSAIGNITITASFEGDAQYAASSGSATGVVLMATTPTTAPTTSPPPTSVPPSSEPFPYWLLLVVVILVLLVGSIAYLAGRRMGRRPSGPQARKNRHDG